MGNGRSCLTILIIWVITCACMIVIFFAAGPIYNQLWLPVGPADSSLNQVAGANFAFTSDGRFFSNMDGPWQQVNRQGQLIWGKFDRSGLAIVATEDTIYYGAGRLSLPKLAKPLVAVGVATSCSSNGAAGEAYAASESELAIYNWSLKSWMTYPLSNTLRAPVVSANCRLFSISPSSNIHYLIINAPYPYNQEAITISEFSTDLSRFEGAVDIASSTQTVWILTRSGHVLKISGIYGGKMTWDELPVPPSMSNPRLMAGTAGGSFGRLGEENIDLWLSGDKNLYRFNHGKQAWQKFGWIYGKKPVALSSLTTSSETVGVSVTRLAIAHGRVFRQQTIVATQMLVMIFIGIPAIVFLSLPVSWLIKVFLEKKGFL